MILGSKDAPTLDSRFRMTHRLLATRRGIAKALVVAGILAGQDAFAGSRIRPITGDIRKRPAIHTYRAPLAI